MDENLESGERNAEEGREESLVIDEDKNNSDGLCFFLLL